MTVENNAHKALAEAFAEGFAQALQPVLMSLNRLANELPELVAAVDRQTAILAAQAAGELDADDAPDIEMPLERFHNFDWGHIGATVLVEDADGPAVVSYGGKAFKRRSPDNKFGEAIWYSRCTGKDEAGNNQYLRLITFKKMSDKVEPLGHKAQQALASAPKPPAPEPPAGPRSAAHFDALPAAPASATAADQARLAELRSQLVSKSKEPFRSADPEKLARYAAGCLRELFKEPPQRAAFLKWVFGTDTTDDLTDGERHALKEWAGPQQVGGVVTFSAQAVADAAAFGRQSSVNS